MKKPTTINPPAARPSSDAFSPEQEAALRQMYPGVDWSKAKVVVDNDKPALPKKKNRQTPAP